MNAAMQNPSSTGVRCILLALLVASANFGIAAAYEPTPLPAERPVIPLWIRDGFAGPSEAGAFREQPAGTPPNGERTNYELQVSFTMTGDVFDIFRCSAAARNTNAFCGDYTGNSIVRHSIDVEFTHTEDALPIPYGLAWLARDLDLDGHVDVVIQRGDPGMGGNGYLDIHSAPDWRQRAHITLTGMKVYFHPLAIDIDQDLYEEIYLTPSSLSGSARAMIIDYQPVTDSFVLIENLAAPNGTGGETAAGDFDDDGCVEFLTGNASGYGLFEYRNETLYYRGPVAGIPRGSAASALRPLPGGVLHALLGHSSFELGYRYHLLRATGDNSFEVVYIFQETTGYAGIQPNLGVDADCDRLDEIVMEFHPWSKVYEWDHDSDAFREIWRWDEAALGTFILWRSADCDQDGVPEWCSADHNYVFRAYEDQDVDPSAVAAARFTMVQPVVWPNPIYAGERLFLRIGPTDSPLRLAIVDASGRMVRSFAPLAPEPTRGAIALWDGRDGFGRTVAAGTYWLSAVEGARTSNTRVVILR